MSLPFFPWNAIAVSPRTAEKFPSGKEIPTEVNWEDLPYFDEYLDTWDECEKGLNTFFYKYKGLGLLPVKRSDVWTVSATMCSLELSLIHI